MSQQNGTPRRRRTAGRQPEAAQWEPAYPQEATPVEGIELPPVEEADTKKAKDARIWVLSFGDFFDYQEYVFITKDPLFILKDKKAVPNSKAKDMNGDPIDFSAMPAVETPAFEAPRF